MPCSILALSLTAWTIISRSNLRVGWFGWQEIRRFNAKSPPPTLRDYLLNSNISIYPCHIGAFAWEFITGFHGSRMLTLRHHSPLKEQHVALSRTWSYDTDSMCRYRVMRTLSIVSARPHSIRASRIRWRRQGSFQKHADDKGNHILVDKEYHQSHQLGMCADCSRSSCIQLACSVIINLRLLWWCKLLRKWRDGFCSDIWRERATALSGDHAKRLITVLICILLWIWSCWLERICGVDVALEWVNWRWVAM